MVGWIGYILKVHNKVLCLLLWVLFMLTNSCSREKNISNTTSVITSSSAVVINKPTLVLLDTCPAAQVVLVNLKSSANANYTAVANSMPANFNLNMPVYNTEQGLPLSTILSSYCDRQGNMWFGTDGGGVSKYNGQTFTNYNTKNGLVNNHIRCILQDSKNNMWFGSFGGGITCFDGLKMTNYSMQNGLASNFVLSIFEDHLGNLLFGCTNGLSKLKKGKVALNDSLAFTPCEIPASLFELDVKNITEDTNKTLWIGTRTGLFFARQNESSKTSSPAFEEFNSSVDLLDYNILSLLIDRDNNMWIGTENGISIFKIPNLNDRHTLSAVSTKTTKDKKISVTNTSAIDGIPIKEANIITEDANGTIWIGCKNGVHYFDGKKFKSLTTKQGLVSNPIKSITVDLQNNLWFASYGAGITLYTGQSIKYYTIAEGLISNDITCCLKDQKNNLWIGTNNGFSTLSGSAEATAKDSCSIYDYDELFLKNTAGLQPLFKNYAIKKGFSGNKIRCIYEDKSGNIWIGSNDFGVSKIAPLLSTLVPNKSIAYSISTAKTYTTANGLMSNNVRAVLEDRVGNMWIVNYGGISKLSKTNTNLSASKHMARSTQETLTNFTLAQGIPEELTYCIAEDHKGNLWFGTQSHGVYCYDGNRVEALNNNTPFEQEDYSGLKKRNGKYIASITNYTMANGLGSDCVFRIREDNHGILWFATYEGGLSRFDASAIEKDAAHLFLNLTVNDGLADNSIYDFVFDKNQNIVAGTNQGFSIIKEFVKKSKLKTSKNQGVNVLPCLNNLSNKILSESYEPTIENFNKKTGFPVKDIVNDAMYCDNDNMVWAGCGDNKLARFDLNSIHQNNKKPTVAIQNIKLNDEAICWWCLLNNTDKVITKPNLTNQISVFGNELNQEQKDDLQKQFYAIEFDSVSTLYGLPQNLKLDYKHNNITFDYTSIDPASASLATYQYLLEGYNTKWNPVTQKTSATFGNINEGNYTFILKSCTANGVWSLPVSYSFTVLPPWYRSMWAYAGYLLSLIAAVWSIIKWREYNYKEKLSFEKRISEVEMQALRSQMNPHFIFNSLHSINKYVLDNDKLNASDYLAKFSKLMRMILENSREQEVTLEKDLAALKLYMQLEALRFQNRFQYTITIADSIDAENTLIAPLLLQPFVENAILHGIREKENGLIKIEIKRAGNLMHCIIEDNGIGREHIVSTESGETLKRKSLGMKITQERLHIIEQLKQVKTTIEITDLKDAENNASGLRIELQLPFEEAF